MRHWAHQLLRSEKLAVRCCRHRSQPCCIASVAAFQDRPLSPLCARLSFLPSNSSVACDRHVFTRSAAPHILDGKGGSIGGATLSGGWVVVPLALWERF